MDTPAHTPSSQLSPHITREAIQNIDRFAEANAANFFTDSMNSLNSLKEIFETSVIQF
jgi:hypothetical protein